MTKAKQNDLPTSRRVALIKTDSGGGVKTVMAWLRRRRWLWFVITLHKILVHATSATSEFSFSATQKWQN